MPRPKVDRVMRSMRLTAETDARNGLTFAEAQTKALAWLDRRFSVEGVED